MAAQIKFERVSFSTQATVITRLPDIPGVIVQVHRVLWMVSSFSAVTAITVVLDHNISLAVTLSVNDFASRWCRIDQAASGGGPPHGDYPFWPEPYELVGAQRFDHVASAGTVIGTLAIIYSTRRERNRTLWNEIRARTSFERG